MFEIIDGVYVLNEQADFDLKNTEEVRLACDTSAAPVDITLPDLSQNGALNLKVFVADNENNAGTENITINAGAGNTINGAASIVIGSNGGSVALFAVNKTAWLAISQEVLSNGLLSATVTLSQAQIQTLGSAPIELVAAPAAGFAINVIRSVSKYDFAVAPFVPAGGGAGAITVSASGAVSQNQAADSDILIAVNDVYGAMSLSSVAGGTSNIFEAAALSLFADDDYNGGDAASTLTVRVLYELIQLP